MGQHTWFLKDKEVSNKMNELFLKLDSHDEGEIYLDDIELLQIETLLNSLDETNETEYHDLFRTDKRQNDGSYIEEELTSLKQTLEWIENPANKVSFKRVYSNTDEQEQIYRREAIQQIHEFWDKYPNGIIRFG